MTIPKEIERIEEQLRKLAKRVGEDLSSVSEHLLPSAQLDVLRCLYERGGLTVSQLANELRVTASAVTSLSNRLVSSHLVQRNADASDRRRVVLDLTPKGRQLFEKIHTERLERIRSYFQRLPESEVTDFAQILSRLVRLIEEGARQREPAT